MEFYNREKEIRILGNITKDFRIAILGRRRIGKTTLIEHFYEKDRVTFFVSAEKAEKEIISDWVKEYPALHLPNVSTFKEFFEFIFFHLKDKVIFIDEIQNILKVNKSFLYDLQRLIDKHRPKLVVSGSLISTMKKIIEDYKSPLYGRFDFIIKLEELDFETVYKICKDFNLDIEHAFMFYSVFGGVPKYYELIEKTVAFKFEDFILDLFVRYPRPLYEEVKTMLKEEFGKEYKTFFSILSAISSGKNKHSEIAAYIGRKQTEITKYMLMLRKDFELIKRKVPVVGGKKGSYDLQNNLFSFWFNNIWRYNELLELEQEENAVEIVKKNLNKHISMMFEKIICRLIISKTILIPFTATTLGSQWGKIPNLPKDKNQYEIDICAINKTTKEILFGECKWQDNVNAETILDELKEKAKCVHWHNDTRKEYYFIFAKSFKKKISTENSYCFDLRNLKTNLA